MIDPAFGYLLSVGLALLFATAAFHKFRDLGRFSRVLAAYRVMPERLAQRLAWSFPCAELAVALALPWPRARHWAALAGAGLLLAYAAGMSLNLARHRRELDCGCTAAGRSRPIAAWMVWRNLILALAAVTGACAWSARPLTGVDWLSVAAGSAAAVALYAAVDRLLGELAPRTALLRGGV
jgi:hypothetical protein